MVWLGLVHVPYRSQFKTLGRQVHAIYSQYVGNIHGGLQKVTNCQIIKKSYYISQKPTNEIRFLCQIKVPIKHYIILFVHDLLCDVTNYRVAQKSKPLSLITIESYWNPPLWLDFSSISTRKWVQEYSMRDLFCDVITFCVWSCDTGKISASDKITFENQKKMWK